MKKFAWLGGAMMILAGLAACQAERQPALGRPAATVAGWIDAARLASDEAGGDSWLTSGGDSDLTHFSRLTDINTGNVGRLGFAWAHDTSSNRVLEATPIVVDGVMYASGPQGVVFALDAATGREIWTFRPEIDGKVYRSVCCDMANRGVAVWKGKVYVGAIDGWLYALDARTGAVAWKADTIVDRDRGYTSTGAPAVANGVVVIGNAGAEYDTRGYVTAYDLETGEQKWRFWTIPGDPRKVKPENAAMEAALKTWDPDSRWDIGGGGTVWDAIVYDARYDTLLIGVGNGGPYHHRVRSPKGGDNLYLSSIVALDPRTGALKWHYQETPGDSWDFTATQPILLTEMVVDGAKRPVILHAPKNGFLYMLDRRDGKLLRAPKIARANWASHVDLKTGQPVLTPEHSDYFEGPKIIFPSSAGAHNWHPMAWNPDTGLLYLSVAENGNLMFIPPGDKPHTPRNLNNAASLIFSGDLPKVLPGLPPVIRDAVKKLPEMQDLEGLKSRAFLRAIDPLTGKRVWEVPTSGWWDRSGVLATAGGLVFAGSDTGHMNVYDARSGKLLKSIDTGSSILAAPMTYRVGGVQYVAVMAAWGGGGWSFPHRTSASYKYGNQGRILVFRLDGGETPKPEPLPPLEPIPAAPAQEPGVTPQTIAQGNQIFMRNCAICHSNQYRSNAPDLRRMSEDTHAAFEQIVLGGLLDPNGMPRWDDLLSPADARAIHAFLTDLQGKTREAEQRAYREGRDPHAEDGLILMTNY